MTEEEALKDLCRVDDRFYDPPMAAAMKAWVQIIARHAAADAVAEALDVPDTYPPIAGHIGGE